MQLRLLVTAQTLVLFLAVYCTASDESPDNDSAVPPASAADDSFQLIADVTATAPAGEGAEISIPIFFSSHYAVEFELIDPEMPAAVYDLDAMSWRQFSPPRTITLKNCEVWQKANSESLQETLAKFSDPKLKRFIELTLEPRFETTRDEDTIELKNEAMRYRMSDPIPLDADQRKHFFAYDRLNAYRKAMVDRKLPPAAQLAVDSELERQDFVPGITELTVQTARGEVQMNMKVRVERLNAEETERVAEAIRNATTAAN